MAKWMTKDNAIKLKVEFLKWFYASPVKATIVLTLLSIIIVSGAIAFLIMTTAVTFPQTQQGDDDKNIWLDVNFQILNAIFTLGALVDQPMRLTGLVMGASLWWNHRCWSKLSSSQSEASPSETEKGQKGLYLDGLRDKCRNSRSRLARYFSWITIEPDLMPTVSSGNDTVLQSADELTPVPSQGSSVDTTPNQSEPQLSVPAPPITNMNHFMYAMVSLTVSTIGQVVMSYMMWVYNPIQVRPQLPFTIALPISFLTNFAGMIWIGKQANKLSVYNEGLVPVSSADK